MFHRLFTPPHPPWFNSQAAEVISIFFFNSYIFTRLPEASLIVDLTDTSVSVHSISLVLYFSFCVACIVKEISDGGLTDLLKLYKCNLVFRGLCCTRHWYNFLNFFFFSPSNH